MPRNDYAEAMLKLSSSVGKAHRLSSSWDTLKPLIRSPTRTSHVQVVRKLHVAHVQHTSINQNHRQQFIFEQQVQKSKECVGE